LPAARAASRPEAGRALPAASVSASRTSGYSPTRDMQPLKNFVVPIVGLAVLALWFFVFRPSLEGDAAGVEARPSPATPAAIGRPQVVALEPQVEGALAPIAVRSVVEAQLAELTECYAQGLARQPAARGRLLLRIVVRGEGSVRAADVAGSQVEDEGIGRCFATKAASWSFPSADDGGSTQVTYPFQLQLEPGD